MMSNTRATFALVLSSLSTMALATGPDVTAITGSVTDVATVAAAVFGVFVAIKAAKFIRRAL